MGAKHNKCCCVECLIAEDDFDRIDNDNPGPLWSEESGDWDIVSGELHGATAGTLALVTCHPSWATLGSLKAQFRLANIANGMVYKVRLGNPASSTLEATWTIGVGTITIEVTDGTDTHSYTLDLIDEEADHIVTVCYMPGVLFSASEPPAAATDSSPGWATMCISAAGAAACHSGLGNFSFLEGDFDDFSAEIHWMEAHACPNCGCYCHENNGTEKFICWPDELTLTLPTGQCPNIPTTYTLYRRHELPESDYYEEPTVVDPSPDLRQWISDEYLTFWDGPGTFDIYFRWRLQCDTESHAYDYPLMKLQLIFYSKNTDQFAYDGAIGNDTLFFDLTYPTSTPMTPLSSRTEAFSLDTSTCDPIVLNFPPILLHDLIFGPSWVYCAVGGYREGVDPDGDLYEYSFTPTITE